MHVRFLALLSGMQLPALERSACGKTSRAKNAIIVETHQGAQTEQDSDRVLPVEMQALYSIVD